jgi:CheY-like chemotaxis protein
VKAENRDKKLDINFLNKNEKKSLDQKKKYKILVISENTLDIYMIKKYLPKVEGYNILEASSLSDALKILNYITLDLIIIDDILQGRDDGYSALEKISSMKLLKDTPKMLLLTKGYEERKLPIYDKNFDYVKKPLDAIVFKHRTQLLIDNAKGILIKKSYFKDLSYQKFLESSSYLSIYHDIFDMDDGMSLIYDRDINSFVESNSAFENFFTNIKLFNRIIFNKKLARDYIPYIDEANYINHYNVDEWMDNVIKNLEFNFSLRVKQSFKEYSFSIVAKKIDFEGRDLYLIKLINILDYIQKNDSEVRSANLLLKENNLSSFKDEFIKLRMLLQKSQLNEQENVDKLIYQLNSKLSILCDDPSIIDDYKPLNRQNIYELILKSLKNHLDKCKITLNSKIIDENSNENLEIFYTKINDTYVNQFINIIVDNISELDILLYESNETIIIEFAYDDNENLIDLNDSYELNTILTSLDATIEILKESNKVIIIVNLPKN